MKVRKGEALWRESIFLGQEDEELGFLCHNPDVGFDQNSERMAKGKAMGFGQTGRNT